MHNDSFASTVLLVCAVGSRFSDDPRVLLEGEESFHSSGWKWFDQVQMVKKSLLAPPSLYDLQFYVVSMHQIFETMLAHIMHSYRFNSYKVHRPRNLVGPWWGSESG